jgi:putative membrane protein
MHFVSSLRQTVRTEVQLFRRFPRLKLATLAIALVPAIYALIYLSSVWDPNAKTSALPVGIVNLDAGMHYQNQDLNVGTELALALEAKGAFAFRKIPDPTTAKSAVEAGTLAFAVVIPPNFSAQAVPGATAGAAKVKVILSEGNNYSSAGFAKRFAVELGHQLNETLNEKRWSLVLSSLDGSGKSLTHLQAGVAQLRSGSKGLSDGAAAYADVATQVAGGFKQVGAGVRTLDTKWPADADLQSLRSGTQALSAGQREMTKGLEQLHTGATRLTEGATQMRDQTASVPLVGSRISKAAGELAAGNAQLVDGLGKARDSSAKLAQGAGQLEAGTAQLVSGVSAMGDGVKTLAGKLPEDARLDAFAAGGKSLASGAARLHAGIELLEASLPKAVGKLDGSARGLADSVEPELEILAPVLNNGSAFAPNMISVALWIGAVMIATLFNMRLMDDQNANLPRLAKSLGKFSAPLLVALLQVLGMFVVVVFGLGVGVSHPGYFVVTLLTASLVFLAMLFAMLRVFGEAGKLLAVLLLTLQLAAGGGIMPIELSGDFFRAVHDWLPFSWVVKAFRVSLFDALQGDWVTPWLVAVGGGVFAFMVATFAGRWKVVSEQDYVPGIDT